MRRSLADGRHVLHVRFSLCNIALLLTPAFVGGYIRGRLYRLAGLNVASDAFLMGNIHIVAGTPNHVANVTIHRAARVSTNVTINCDGPVSIGENVTIGPFVKIYTATHDLGPGSHRSQPELVIRPVAIEKGCWVAVGATILPGVTVGHGSVVAAGAIVDRNVPPNSYVAGVPAVVVRTLPLGDR